MLYVSDFPKDMAVLGSQGFPLRLLVWPDLYSMSGLKHQRCHSYALLALWILGSSSLIEVRFPNMTSGFPKHCVFLSVSLQVNDLHLEGFV